MQGNVKVWGFWICSSSRMCSWRVSSPCPEMHVLWVFKYCAGLQHKVADSDFQATSAHRPPFYNSWIKSIEICFTIGKTIFTTAFNTSICLCGGGGGFLVDIESIYGICPRILQIKVSSPTLYSKAYQYFPFLDTCGKWYLDKHWVRTKDCPLQQANWPGSSCQLWNGGDWHIWTLFTTAWHTVRKLCPVTFHSNTPRKHNTTVNSRDSGGLTVCTQSLLFHLLVGDLVQIT